MDIQNNNKIVPVTKCSCGRLLLEMKESEWTSSTASLCHNCPHLMVHKPYSTWVGLIRSIAVEGQQVFIKRVLTREPVQQTLQCIMKLATLLNEHKVSHSHTAFFPYSKNICTWDEILLERTIEIQYPNPLLVPGKSSCLCQIISSAQYSPTVAQICPNSGSPTTVAYAILNHQKKWVPKCSSQNCTETFQFYQSK